MLLSLVLPLFLAWLLSSPSAAFSFGGPGQLIVSRHRFGSTSSSSWSRLGATAAPSSSLPAPPSSPFAIVIPQELADVRLDAGLHALFFSSSPHFSRSFFAALAANEGILLASPAGSTARHQPLKKSFVFKGGERLLLDFSLSPRSAKSPTPPSPALSPQPDSGDTSSSSNSPPSAPNPASSLSPLHSDLHSQALTPHYMNLTIIYEDAHIVVLNKDAGVVTHPAYGNYNNTLLNGVLHHLNEQSTAKVESKIKVDAKGCAPRAPADEFIDAFIKYNCLLNNQNLTASSIPHSSTTQSSTTTAATSVTTTSSTASSPGSPPPSALSSALLPLTSMWYAKPNGDDQAIFRPGIVHRLDKGTSGCIIICKTTSSHAALSRDFANRRGITKRYLAVCVGNCYDPNPQAQRRAAAKDERVGKTGPLKLEDFSTIKIQNYMGRDTIDRRKMRVIPLTSPQYPRDVDRNEQRGWASGGGGGDDDEDDDADLPDEPSDGHWVLSREEREQLKGTKFAVTHVTPLTYDASTNLSLNSVKIETGRTHQIRVHMASPAARRISSSRKVSEDANVITAGGVGAPILGDEVYGQLGINEKFFGGRCRTMLHSHSIEINHPAGLGRMRFIAELNGDMKFVSEHKIKGGKKALEIVDEAASREDEEVQIFRG